MAFVLAGAAIKVAVMTSSVARITFVVGEISFKVPMIIPTMVKITFVETEITFSVSDFSVLCVSGQYHLSSG